MYKDECPVNRSRFSGRRSRYVRILEIRRIGLLYEADDLVDLYFNVYRAEKNACRVAAGKN